MSLFASSLTESALVAFVMAVIFNFLVWFLGVGVEVADNETVRAVSTALGSVMEAQLEGARDILIVFLHRLSASLTAGRARRYT